MEKCGQTEGDDGEMWTDRRGRWRNVDRQKGTIEKCGQTEGDSREMWTDRRGR